MATAYKKEIKNSPIKDEVMPKKIENLLI